MAFMVEGKDDIELDDTDMRSHGSVRNSVKAEGTPVLPDVIGQISQK